MMRATQQISDGTKTKVVVALVRHGVISSINRISPTELMMRELEQNGSSWRVLKLICQIIKNAFVPIQ